MTASRVVVIAAVSLALLCKRSGALGICTLRSTPGASFGSYNVFTATPLDTTTTITYRCTAALAVTIEISIGSSTSYAARTLRSGSQTLSYNLYRDAARTQIWGDGSAQTVRYGPVIGLLSDVVVPVYARIPARQDVATGSYTDTVVVTLHY